MMIDDVEANDPSYAEPRAILRDFIDVLNELADLLTSVAAADSLNTIRGRRAKLAQFQARADSVCALMGSTAPRPLEGESVNGYARRILRPWAKFSDEWKGIDLGTLRGPTLGVAASAIMKAAADEAKCPQVPHGMLMERKRSDGAGHFITTFHGNPSAWMSRFSGPRRYVKQINMKPSNGYSAN